MHPTGKRVLITGAGHGLGRAMAFALAKEGAEIVAASASSMGRQVAQW